MPKTNIFQIISNMPSPRALELLRELAREAGVTGSLLPGANGRVESRLALDVTWVPKDVLEDIFPSSASEAALLPYL